MAVITDKGLVDAGIHTPLMASLKGAGVEALLYDQAELDPTPASIEKAAAWVRQNKVELLVGLGGAAPWTAPRPRPCWPCTKAP